MPDQASKTSQPEWSFGITLANKDDRIGDVVFAHLDGRVLVIASGVEIDDDVMCDRLHEANKALGHTVAAAMVASEAFVREHPGAGVMGAWFAVEGDSDEAGFDLWFADGIPAGKGRTSIALVESDVDPRTAVTEVAIRNGRMGMAPPEAFALVAEAMNREPCQNPECSADHDEPITGAEVERHQMSLIERAYKGDRGAILGDYVTKVRAAIAADMAALRARIDAEASKN